MATSDRDTRLIEAVMNGDTEEVKRSLRSGADPNAKSRRRDWSALHWAAYHGDATIARLLINAEADVEECDNEKRWMPIHVVRSAEVTRLLLRAGADPDAVDRDGNTPLVYAITRPEKNHSAEEILRIVKCLIDAGASVNLKDSGGRTMLHRAVYARLPDVLRTLLEAGADISVVADEIGTPLHYAAALEFDQVVSVLIENGASIDNTDAPLGWTPLHYAVRHESSESAKRLIEAGADVNIPDETGTPPISMARNDAIRRLLMDAGASPED